MLYNHVASGGKQDQFTNNKIAVMVLTPAGR
jgi:hypothetical protein